MKFSSKARSSRVRPQAHNSQVRHRGFTLIEMVVVISLILVLLSIAMPMYSRAVLHARETRLHANLKTLNEAIENFSLNKKQAPQSLDDLVPGYVKFIPEDITGSNTWQTEAEDSQDAWDPNQTGIKSVHSGSNEVSSDGRPYSAWDH